jgi:hypothetical protein
MTAIRRVTSSAPAIVEGALAGLAAGALTAYLQAVLPADWNTVANSGAVWTLVAFAVAAAVARSVAAAAGVGLLVLVGEVAGYYFYTAGIRHIPVLHSQEVLWTTAALWIGPLTGWAAFFTRWGTPTQRVISVAAMCGVVAGEGAYLIRIGGMPKSGWVEVIVGALIAAVALVVCPASIRIRLLSAMGGVVVAAAVYGAYSQSVLA